MKAQFLKEWNPQQFKAVQKAIVKYINSRYWESHHSPDADPFIKLCKKVNSFAASVLCPGYSLNNLKLTD